VNLDRAVEGWGVLERAVDLARRGTPFVLATVVWREGPSSGQHGSRAIFTATGEIHGWIGGACAEPVFKREAVKTLEAGLPRLLALGASDRFGDLPDGTMAVEIVIIGDSPMAQTLCEQASQLDWNVELVGGPDFSEGLLSSHSVVVVATQGHGDEDIVVAALKASPAYVGVVASAKRGEIIRSFLAQSFDETELDALRVPAGLDLGSTTHKEMAVAILADLVQRRAAGEFTAAIQMDLPQVETAIDPICGMTVDAVDTSHPLDVGDMTYYFCCPGCRAAFGSQQGV